jgi:hypothetical protein
MAGTKPAMLAASLKQGITAAQWFGSNMAID